MKTKVLVVDDDVVSRMMLMHVIGTFGEFDIAEAEDGEQAWELLESGAQPAIVFSDLRMPRLSGLDLLRRMRAAPRHAQVPFVLATAASDRETVEQAGDYGACGFIAKPLVPEQVRAHLDRCLPRSGAASEAPADTLHRLGIDRARLAAYLGGLRRQLDEIGGEAIALIQSGETGAARLRLIRLQEGCRTLGLAAAAAALDDCADTPAEATVRAALDCAIAAVELQQRRLSDCGA
jgi:two-component system chemotaxis response regulator CheY